jgi:peroxiredoxin Q/BCP
MKLNIGGKAPGFVLKNQDEADIELKDYLGKWIVLYFYPKDNTSGCTLEAKDFTCLKNEFSALNAIVMGVSKDL